MRAWIFLLGGLLVWAADFFLLYAISSIFLTTTLARILAIAVTIAALAADGALIAHALARYRSAPADYDRWFAKIALLMAGISAVAVVWQGFPAILA